MQFLKTLFWVVLAVILVLFARGNWTAVTLKLWGGLEADIKLPLLILAAFLLGFLPTFILYRARLWSLRRRLDAQERQPVIVPPSASTPTPVPAPTIAPGSERTVTDSNVWPAT